MEITFRSGSPARSLLMKFLGGQIQLPSWIFSGCILPMGGQELLAQLSAKWIRGSNGLDHCFEPGICGRKMRSRKIGKTRFALRTPCSISVRLNRSAVYLVGGFLEKAQDPQPGFSNAFLNIFLDHCVDYQGIVQVDPE